MPPRDPLAALRGYLYDWREEANQPTAIGVLQAYNRACDVGTQDVALAYMRQYLTPEEMVLTRLVPTPTAELLWDVAHYLVHNTSRPPRLGAHWLYFAGPEANRGDLEQAIRVALKRPAGARKIHIGVPRGPKLLTLDTLPQRDPEDLSAPPAPMTILFWHRTLRGSPTPAAVAALRVYNHKTFGWLGALLYSHRWEAYWSLQAHDWLPQIPTPEFWRLSPPNNRANWFSPP